MTAGEAALGAPDSNATSEERLQEHIDEAEPGQGSAAKSLPVPVLPSAEEVDDHNVCHLPHRTWCRHCIAGRGKADRHVSDGQDDHRIPTLHSDYAFMGEKSETEIMDERNLPIIVTKDGGTKWVDAHVVQSKGIQHQYSVKALARDLEAAGYANFLYKSDNEPALIALKRAAVAELRRQGQNIEV